MDAPWHNWMVRKYGKLNFCVPDCALIKQMETMETKCSVCWTCLWYTEIKEGNNFLRHGIQESNFALITVYPFLSVIFLAIGNLKQGHIRQLASYNKTKKCQESQQEICLGESDKILYLDILIDSNFRLIVTIAYR